MTTFRVDDENHADEFWTHVNQYDVIHMAPISDAARASVAPLLTDGSVDEASVEDEIAEELLDWFGTLPGWDGGPEYAPHPLTWQEE